MHKIENLQFKIKDPVKLGSDNMEESKIRYALDVCIKLYETPTYRAYKGIKSMIDK